MAAEHTEHRREQETRTWLWLAAIVALGAGLRLYALGRYSLWYDECASLYLGRYVPGLELFDITKNSEPPVNALLAWAWSRVVGLFGFGPRTVTNDFLLRLLPCLLGTAVIPLAFVWIRRIAKASWPALLAALLLAVSPFQVYYSQELRVYPFYLLVCLLTSLCAWRALHEDHWRWWAGLTLGLALLLYSHFFSVWFMFTLSVFYLCMAWRYWPLVWKWAVANAAALVLAIPALRIAYNLQSIVAELEYAWYPNPTVKTALITFKTFFAGYAFYPWAYWPLFLMAGALFVFGLAALYRRRPEAALFVLVLVLVPMAGATIVWSIQFFSFYWHRLFIFSGVMATAAVAFGIHALPMRRVRLAVLAVFLGLTAVCLHGYYAQHLHPIEHHRRGVSAKVDFRGATRLIHDRLEPGDVVGVASTFSVYPLYHYLPEAELRHIAYSDKETEGVLKSIGNEPLLRAHKLLPIPKEESLEGVRRLWLVQSKGPTFENQVFTKRLRDWLDAHWPVVSRHQFDGLTITLYKAPAARPQT